MRSIAAALLLCAALPAGAREVPALTGLVVDEAGLLDPGGRRRLEALSRAAFGQQGEKQVQLQYLLVRSLQGDALEDFSIRVAEKWRIGTKGRDNGVLVLVAVEDRKVRIEVGGGLEGGLTDAQSGRIIRNTIAPAFREGRYGEGLYAAGVQVLSALGALPSEVASRARRTSPGSPGLTLAFMLLIAMVIVFGIASSIRQARRGFRGRRGGWGGFGGGGPWIGGGGLGGGFGGGGGGGGGWSGGGGGFSGGGASGGW
jgi:uncharacterized protein